MGWLHWTAAGLFGLAAAVCLVRHAKSKKSGKLFVGGCFLLAGGLFGYLALSSGQKATPPPLTPISPVSGEQPTLRARLIKVGKGPLPELIGHENEVESVAFSGDGKTLASGDSYDMTVRLWDVATGKEKAMFVPNRYIENPFLALGNPNAPHAICVAFSGDGKTVASGSRDQTVALWDVATSKEKATLRHSSWLRSVAFSSDGKTLASLDMSGMVRLWDVATGKEKGKYTEAAALSLALSGDGDLLAAGTGIFDADKKDFISGEIKLLVVAGGKVKATLKGHTNRVVSVAFSADGKLLASGSADGTLKLWEVASGKETATFFNQSDRKPTVASVAFSGDGKLLAGASWWAGGTVWLWDVATGKEMAILTGQGVSYPKCVALSGHGKVLAVVGKDGLHLWDIPSGKKADE